MTPDQVPAATTITETDEIQKTLAADLARSVDENLVEYRECMDRVDTANALKSTAYKRRTELDRWAAEYRQNEGVDQLKVDGVLTISMKDAVRWTVGDWEAFVVGLVGIDVTNTEAMNKLRDVVNDWDADGDETAAAIRGLLVFGDLHVVNKMKSDGKIDALIASGVELHGDLSPNGYTKIKPLRPPGSATLKEKQ